MEITLQDVTAVGRVISLHDLTHILITLKLNRALVLIDKAKPKPQEMVGNALFKRPTIGLREDRPHTLNQ